MKQVKKIILFLVICSSTFAQDKPLTISESQKAASVKKAEQVLLQAKNAVSKKTKIADIKNLTVISETSRELSVAGKIIPQTSKVETSFALPNKIHRKNSSNQSNSQQQENYTLNGSEFYAKLDVFVDGKLQNIDVNNYSDKKSQISYLTRETFLLVFPMTLNASWYIPLEFSYVGIAESKDGKAEVIEAVSPNKARYRLFFDPETHLLLLMTENWTDKNNKQNENKYFFSNHQEKDGLLIATKIITEENGEVVEEKEIKDLKINPNFKSDLFEVKGK